MLNLKKFEMEIIDNSKFILGGGDPKICANSIQQTEECTIFLGFIIHTGSKCDTVKDC